MAAQEVESKAKNKFLLLVPFFFASFLDPLVALSSRRLFSEHLG